jgi:hypothetical protein
MSLLWLKFDEVTTDEIISSFIKNYQRVCHIKAFLNFDDVTKILLTKCFAELSLNFIPRLHLLHNKNDLLKGVVMWNKKSNLGEIRLG